MITYEEIYQIIKESPFTFLYGLEETDIGEIASEVYSLVGEVYAG